MSEKKKKTAIDVVIDSFIKRVQKDGVMPWQNPPQVRGIYQLGI